MFDVTKIPKKVNFKFQTKGTIGEAQGEIRNLPSLSNDLRLKEVLMKVDNELRGGGGD